MEFGGPVNTGDWEAFFVEIEEGGGSLDKDKSSAVYQSEEWDWRNSASTYLPSEES